VKRIAIRITGNNSRAELSFTSLGFVSPRFVGLTRQSLIALLVLSGLMNVGAYADSASGEENSQAAADGAVIHPVKLSQADIAAQEKPALPSIADRKEASRQKETNKLAQNLRPLGKQMVPTTTSPATPSTPIQPAPAPSAVSPSLETTPLLSPTAQPEAPTTTGTSIESPGLAPPAGIQEQSPQSSTATPLLHVRAALNYAIVESPRIAAVRAQLGIQKALYVAATQMPNPVFFEDNGFYAEEVRRVGATLVYDPPWKIAFRMLAAKRQVKESKLEILNTLWQFRNDVRRAYTELGVAQESYQILVDLYDLANRLYEVTNKRFQAGDVPELDVLKARLAVSQASIDRDVGLIRIQKAKQALNVMMGRPYQSEIDIPRLPTYNQPMFKLQIEKSDLLPNLNAPPPALKDLIARAMDQRWDLKVVKQQIAVAQAQLYTAAGNIIPDPSYGIGSSVGGNPPTGPQLKGYFLTLNIELPVFTYSQGDIARLRATIKQYHAQYAATQNQVVQDVTLAYNSLMMARDKIKVYQEHILADADEVARLARRSYEVGAADITSTLQAQQQNVQTKQAYLDAVTNYTQAYTDLEQSTGEPMDY
jgi:cobalt-zinc-cadmium efflux system outer membrane protein